MPTPTQKISGAIAQQRVGDASRRRDADSRRAEGASRDELWPQEPVDHLGRPWGQGDKGSQAPPLVLRETPELFDRNKEAGLAWNDGRLATEWKMDEHAVVTTANATWMPEFPVAMPGRICTRSDGRWGPQEYSLWPQMYHSRVLHHACIPVKDGDVEGFETNVRCMFDVVDPSCWAADTTCGVPDLGFLSPRYLNLLKSTAQRVIIKYQTCGDDKEEKQKQFGYHLSQTIYQALDQLFILLTWRTHAVALASHVQRLTLELCGLIVLFDVVQPRVHNRSFVAKTPLAVRGAFTDNAGTAQGLFRLGIPTWFIQPLTSLVRVVKAVNPTPVSSQMSDELSQPRLYSGDGDLAGIVQHPGDWPFKMQQEVLKNLCDVKLPSMPRVLDTDGAPPAKKARADNSADSNLDRVQTNQPGNSSQSGHSSRRTHRGKRAAAPTQPVPVHPSLCYQRPKTSVVPEVWAEALTAVGTLPPPRSASTFYWPPPFWFESQGEKVKRYFHNYVRIRGFCRQRLLDPTLGAEPLRIAEWRDALWGDYQVQVSEATSTTLSKKNKDRRDVQQNIRRLFSKTAGLPTYDSAQSLQWGANAVNVDSVNGPAVRAQILWEVHEINWRCEMRELDAALTNSHEWGTLQRWEREARCGEWPPHRPGQNQRKKNTNQRKEDRIQQNEDSDLRNELSD
ncbi:uncharacterized protein B0H18DRAFT_1210474 [Fomitopsis serialis]|uniref:uncharacterized protein n=1 Tax=Fomitopsis serialis TaxID=139415 RepID=UPI00200729A8|nr:uncharacterized protein B0H18DRAFT_1210474 [Neoantrodia serialis]KAH9927713.1 hypothetical protein B0H18DRAFT_1210474 [Neoantrodia serialis]